MIEITEKRHTGKRAYYVIEIPYKPFAMVYCATMDDCDTLPDYAESITRTEAVKLVKQARTLAAVKKNQYTPYICPAEFWEMPQSFFEDSPDFMIDVDSHIYERVADYEPMKMAPVRQAYIDYMLPGNFTRAQRNARRKYEAKAKRTAACGLTVEQFERLKRYAAANDTTICAILHAYIMAILDGMEDN